MNNAPKTTTREESEMSDRVRDEIYRRLSFGSSVGFGECPALIVIDFQKGETLEEGLFYGRHDEQIAETNRILAAMRTKRYPVLFTVVAYDEAEIANSCYTFVKKMPAVYRHLRVGSKLVEVDDRLNPRFDEFIIVKKFQSAFMGTPVSSILTGLRVDTLIVAGCATSGCVRGTVIDASAQGYRVILARECVGDYTEEVHSASIFDMNAKNGDVLDVDAVLEYINALPTSERRIAVE